MRRTVLRAAVASPFAVGLAGCLSVSSDGGDEDDVPVSTPTATPTPTDYPTPAFDQDCIGHDPDAIEIEEHSGGYRIVEGGHILLAFDAFENAKKARDVIKHYGFTQHCFVGRPDPPMRYWLADRGE